MTSAVGETTRCPRCDGDLDYRLGVANGGGFRYDVSCSACGDLYYHFSTPLAELPTAA